MSFNVLLSCLYCPNSNLLDPYVEKEQGFFIPSMDQTIPPISTNWTCWKSKLQALLIAGLSRNSWQFPPALVKQWCSAISVLLISKSWSRFFACTFPIVPWSLFHCWVCTHLPVLCFLSQRAQHNAGTKAGGAGQGFPSKKQHKQG